MQIRGKLSERSPGELLEWLRQEKKTGALRFFKIIGSVKKEIFFEEGEIVSSATSEPREFLGSYLIAKGLISEKDFVQAYKTQVETKVLFGKILTMIGKVTENDVALCCPIVNGTVPLGPTTDTLDAGSPCTGSENVSRNCVSAPATSG